MPYWGPKEFTYFFVAMLLTTLIVPICMAIYQPEINENEATAEDQEVGKVVSEENDDSIILDISDILGVDLPL
jgi:hypothetical protein